MPTPAETHQAGQSALIRDLLRAVTGGAWPQFNPQAIGDTTPRLSLAILALVRSYGSAASVHAADFYKQERTAARQVGRFTVPLADPPDAETVSKQVEWATADLYKASEPSPKSSPTYDLSRFVIKPEAVDATLTKVQGVATKLVLDQSRDTLLEAVKKDPKARGWARVPEVGACSFCLMLATRGAVYKTRESGGFRSHDHCHCHVEPLWGSTYEPTATVRAAQALYKQSARPGSSDPLNNFRTALQRERDAGRFAG